MATHAYVNPSSVFGDSIGGVPTDAVDTGLHAARSPLKILNHLDLSEEHDMIARVLGVHRLYTEPNLFAANKEVLKTHQEAIERMSNPRNRPVRIGFRNADYANGCAESEDSAERAIARLCENGCKYGLQLRNNSVRSALRTYARAAQVEFHPSDICNERCRGCTYGHDDPAMKPPAICFPYDRLEYIAQLDPRAVVLVGGGEPFFYKDPATGKKFPDLVERLRALLPASRFGLITNGTVFPDRDWYRHFDWIRFSIDAADSAAYARVRGRDLFDRVCANLCMLLRRTTTQQINIGYVFSHENIGDAARAAEFFFDLVDRQCPEALSRVCVEYRPLRRDTEDEERDFPEAVTPADVSLAEADFERLASSRPGVAQFLRARTNWDIIRLGNAHEPVGFSHCGYSSIFRLVRASGEVRPCCMRLAEPQFYLGNVLTNPPESIALNVLFNAHYLRPGCDGPGCKLGRVNRLVENGLAGHTLRSAVAAVALNPFFG